MYLILYHRDKPDEDEGLGGRSKDTAKALSVSIIPKWEVIMVQKESKA